MTSANRLQLSLVRETVPGVTPDTPRMRKMRITGESLQFSPTYVDSDEIRDDRMLGDPIKTMQASSGGINFETSYPPDNTPLSEVIRSAMYSAWANTPEFFNDGVAASAITNAGNVANTYGVAAGGAAVKANHLVRATGFANGANNQVFAATASTGTTVVGAALGLVADVAPGPFARLKVVGIQGAAGDITALVDGIGSTAVDFTTFPELVPGKWLKIGGTADASQFAFLVTAGLKARKAAWARITAVAAHKITMDNLPTGWGADAGAGKTIKIWFGDQIKNGVLQTSLTIERGFLGQIVPSYIVNTGMVANTFTQEITSGDKIKGSVSFTGMGGGIFTVPLDATPEAVTVTPVMAANANVGRLGVNGSRLIGPNWAKSITFQIDNNLRALDSVDEDAPVAINDGECKVTGKTTTYFGSDAEVAAFYAGTPRSLNARVAKNGQALIYQIPRATYRGGGNPSASAKNTDVMADFDYQSSKDELTNAHIVLDRVEYFEE
jgi:hypothetical protein